MSVHISKGGCQCGEIKISLKGEPVKSFICYCIDCRKGSGHLGQILSYYDTKNIEITDSKSYLREFIVGNTKSGVPKKKEFCGNCGSTIRTLPMKYNGEVSVVRPTLLDENFKMCVPKIAIFGESNTEYVEGLQNDFF